MSLRGRQPEAISWQGGDCFARVERSLAMTREKVMMTNGWHVGKFGDVLEPVSRPVRVEPDKVYRNLGVQWYAKGLFVREEKPGYDIKARELYRVEVGDLVYNRLFAWKGSFAIAEEDTAGGFVSGEFPCFHVDTSKAEPKFLHLYLSQEKIWQEIERISTGQTNISRLRLKEPVFLNMEIPLPPLAEQRRIVARIEALAARVNQAQRLREEAEKEREAIGVSARNEIFSHLAKTVKPLRFEEIAEMRLGKMLSQASKVGATPLPYLRNANIQWDRLDLSNVNTMDFSEDEKPIFRLKAGDILVCEGGDIGKSAIWNDELPECYFQKALHRIRVNAKLTFPRFILHHIFWAAEQNHFFDLKTQTTIPHLTGVKLKAYDIYLPPLDEQRRIVAYLDGLQAKVNALRELQSQTGAELDALMPSILDKAFKGEL